jgi:predicted ThiF/HesA family dinucleotide-utilizing enzyme
VKTYEPTQWQDRIVGENGEVIREGTPVTPERLQKIEDAIAELYRAIAELQVK